MMYVHQEKELLVRIEMAGNFSFSWGSRPFLQISFQSPIEEAKELARIPAVLWDHWAEGYYGMRICDLTKIHFLPKKKLHLGSFISVYTPKTFQTFCGVTCAFLQSSGQMFRRFCRSWEMQIAFWDIPEAQLILICICFPPCIWSINSSNCQGGLSEKDPGSAVELIHSPISLIPYAP